MGFYFFLRIVLANPIMPVIKSSKLAGSGTSEVVDTIILSRAEPLLVRLNISENIKEVVLFVAVKKKW